MKSKRKILFASCGALLFLLQGCTLTSHPLGAPAIGKASSSAEMERLIDQPGTIQLETINSVDWSLPLAGPLNLKSPAAIAAGLKDRDEAIQIYVHVLKHPQRGNYLVDTGVSKKIMDNPSGGGHKLADTKRDAYGKIASQYRYRTDIEKYEWQIIRRVFYSFTL